jgi:hypothetical protein
MSDVRTGWTELLIAPLGPESPVDTPLGVLPCVAEPPELGAPLVPLRPVVPEG